MVNEPNGEREVGSVTIWRTAKLDRQWSIKVTEHSTPERLAECLQLARSLDRKLMHSRPKKKVPEPESATVKVPEKTRRRVRT